VEKVCQLLALGQWFSPGTPASSTTKTGRHDIAEILVPQNRMNFADFNLQIKVMNIRRLRVCGFYTLTYIGFYMPPQHF
jgi:hypothetical protein